MAQFTQQMLRDLLASPDPNDQELARQLAAEAAQTAPPPEQMQAQDQIAPAQEVPQPMQQPVMTGGSQPLPADLPGDAFSQAAYRRQAYGPGNSAPIQNGTGSFQNTTDAVPEVTRQSVPENQSGASGAPVQVGTPAVADPTGGVRVLDQMRQRDGSIFQLIERETPTGLKRETRVVMPPELDPYNKIAQTYRKGEADIEHVKAETAKAGETPAQAAERVFQTEKAKLKAQNAGFEGAGTASGVTGPDVLANVPTGIATQVKKLASGEMAFPGGFAMRSPYWQNMLTLTAQYDPSFDATNFNKRNQTAASFSKGMQGNSVRAVNQTIMHMDNLLKNIDALDNFNGITTPLNSIVNPVESAFGDPRQGNFKQTVQAVASELRRVFSTGGVGNLMELKQWEDTLPVNASKEQQTSYLQNGVTLLNGALQALDSQYKAGMGLNASVTDLLTPKAKSALAKLEGPQSQVASKQPSTAPQMGTMKNGYIFKGGNPANPSSWMRQ